jgi:hypothetical protein
MIVHLSTSSSSDRLPTGHWPVVWFTLIVLFLLGLVFIEYNIRRSGWSPSVVDSKQLWAKQRKRASDLKDQAVILVGKSRIQLGMDLDVVKQVSQKEPVQLAIDGTPLMPVLHNLAQDPNVIGTVIVSVTSGLSFDITGSRSSEWIKSYQDRYSKNREPYKIINGAMMAFFDNNMVTRFEGAKPFTIISSLAFKAPSLGNYLVTHQNRSRDADYKKVQMPHFYLTRAQRHFGENLIEGAVSVKSFFSIYEQAINNLQPKDNSQFLIGLDSLISIIHTIEERGGKVILGLIMGNGS